MKEKLKQIILSRKYHVLAIATIAFFLTSKFSENALLVTFGIYVGGNVIDKGVAMIAQKKDIGGQQ